MGASNQPLVYPWNPCISCMVYPENGWFPCKNRCLEVPAYPWWKRCPKRHWVGRSQQVSHRKTTSKSTGTACQRRSFRSPLNGSCGQRFWKSPTKIRAPACLRATDHSRVYSVHFHFGMQTCFSWVVSSQGFTIILGPMNKDHPEIFHLPQPIKQSVTASPQRTAHPFSPSRAPSGLDAKNCQPRSYGEARAKLRRRRSERGGQIIQLSPRVAVGIHNGHSFRVPRVQTGALQCAFGALQGTPMDQEIDETQA